jgi:hypothetical protein
MTELQYPPVLDLPAAARLLGIGRTLAYQLVRTGQWPTPVIRVGRLIKVPTQPLLELLRRGDVGPSRLSPTHPSRHTAGDRAETHDVRRARGRRVTCSRDDACL